MSCDKCGLCRTRRNEVVGRGSVPADVLIIGEAPGRVEDLRGEPFIGPSGKLLQRVLDDLTFTWYITNVCRCRPCDGIGEPNRSPTPEEAWACFPNLMEVYQRVKPIKVVLLGEVAKRYCIKTFKSATCLYHPAYVLRTGGTGGANFRAFRRGFQEVQRELQDGV